jgi:hypothetical protein
MARRTLNTANPFNIANISIRKKFTFRLEGLPALCIVLHILGIGKVRNAFRDDFTSILHATSRQSILGHLLRKSSFDP